MAAIRLGCIRSDYTDYQEGFGLARSIGEIERDARRMRIAAAAADEGGIEL